MSQAHNPSEFPDLQLHLQLLEKAKKLFEAEQYQEATTLLEQAQVLVSFETTVGKEIQSGEIQIWLANSYDALGRTKEAIAICQKLIDHSDPVISKQADYLLSVFSALPINQLTDVTSTLPNLIDLEASNSRSFTIFTANTLNSLTTDTENKAAQLLPANKQVNQRVSQRLIGTAIATFVLIFVWWLAIWLYRFTQIK